MRFNQSALRGKPGPLPAFMFLALAGILAFAVPGPVGAQTTANDLEQTDWDFSTWTGTMPGAGTTSSGALVITGSSVFSPSGGGTPATLLLPGTWSVVITSGGSESGDIEVFFGVTKIADDSFDFSSAIWENTYSSGGSAQLWVCFGTNDDDDISMVDYSPDATHSLIFGMGGADVIEGNDEMSTLDVIFGGDDSDELFGYDGNDILWGDWIDDSTWIGEDLLDGGNDNDFLFGCGETGNGNVLLGRDGNDWVFGGGGIDYCFGGDGRDHIEGAGDDDYIEGNDGCDDIWGDSDTAGIGGSTLPILLTVGSSSDGDDEIYGDDDPTYTEFGSDYIECGGGADVAHGGPGNDVIDGGTGVDDIYGDDDDDLLVDLDFGADDYLEGADGGDTLISVDGSMHGGDELNGGTGTDDFHYESNDMLTDGTPVGGEGNSSSLPTGFTTVEAFAFGTYWPSPSSTPRDCT